MHALHPATCLHRPRSPTHLLSHTHRQLPGRRSLATTSMLLGSSSWAVVRWLTGSWLPSLYTFIHNRWLLAYVTVMGLLGAALTYLYGGVENTKLNTLMRVGLQLLGLLLLYAGTWTQPAVFGAAVAAVLAAKAARVLAPLVSRCALDLVEPACMVLHGAHCIRSNIPRNLEEDKHPALANVTDFLLGAQAPRRAQQPSASCRLLRPQRPGSLAAAAAAGAQHPRHGPHAPAPAALRWALRHNHPTAATAAAAAVLVLCAPPRALRYAVPAQHAHAGLQLGGAWGRGRPSLRCRGGQPAGACRPHR